ARACAAASVSATTDGGTAITATSAGTHDACAVSSGSSSPAPRWAASLAASWSASASQTRAPLSRSASATDVPISPVPRTATRTMFPLLGDVEAEGGGTAQVDVLDRGPRPVRLDVRHQPHHAGHGAGH